MIKKLLLSGLTLFSLFLNAQPILGSYNFANVTSSSGTVDPTPTPTATGVTFSPFTAVGCSTNPNTGFRFSYTGWPTGATHGIDTYSSFTGVLTPTAYYEVSLTPQTGYSLNLTSINFSMRRSSTGIRNFAVRSSMDNFANNLSAAVTSPSMSVVSPDIFFWTFDNASNAADLRGNSVNLGAPFTSFTNSVSFRFYAWNAEGSGGTFSIDSVVFFGVASNTTLVPVTSVKKNEESLSAIQVFPNPSHDGIFTINSSSPFKHIEIVNLLGQMVWKYNQPNEEIVVKADLSRLPNGTYFVKVSSDHATKVERVVLTR